MASVGQAAQEKCIASEPVKCTEKGSLKEIPPVLESTRKASDMISVIKPTEREDPFKHYMDNENIVLRLRGDKERLKQLMMSTVFRSFAEVLGINGSPKQMKNRRVLQGSVKCKRDGFPTKRILQEEDANKIIEEVEIMQKLCKESEKIRLPGVVDEVSLNVVRYWVRRYTLFSRFDEGTQIDNEGLFSVTPEVIAKHQAQRLASCARGTLIDAFTGVGGNAIQFALMGFHVIAIDIDENRLQYARNNAEVYGVSERIDFIHGDFFQLYPHMKADVMFLSPPWGGPQYIKSEKYDIETMLRPFSGFYLFKLALSVAPNIAYFLPKTTDVEQLDQLSRMSDPPLPYEIEKNYLNDELIAITIYYGKIAGKN